MKNFLLSSFVGTLVLSCSPKASLKSGRLDIPPRDPPQTEVSLVKNELTGGLASLKGKKITAFLIFNHPDGYLIRAKRQINPPDFAIREVLDLQEERQNWFNEALVVNCDDCPAVEVDPPLKVLSEADLLSFIDRVSLNQDPTPADWGVLGKEAPKSDYLWLVLGSEDYEQKRGPAPAPAKNQILARTESEVRLRSFFYEKATRQVKHAIHIRGWDVTENLYPLRGTDWNVAPSDFDSLQFDSIYTYPTVPETPPIIQKALLRLTETLNP